MKIALLTIFIIVVVGLALYFYKTMTRIVKNSQPKFSYKEYLNQKFLDLLNEKYPALNFTLDGDKITNHDGLQIEAKIVNHREFSENESFQINFFTSYRKYFENPIEERLVGIGNNDATAIENGLQSFLSGQFPVIIDCLHFKHDPDKTFDIQTTDEAAHWHSITGDIQLQGELSKVSEPSIYERSYSFIRPFLATKLKNSNQNFHWFRYYISRTESGDFIGDCYYDNEASEEGLAILKNYVSTWAISNKFSGQKQFIMLRKCED